MRNSQIKTVVVFIASVLALNLITIATSQAQVSVGIKVAGNMTNYQKLTTGNFGIEPGIFLRLGKNFYFQPEVSYVFKSSTFKDVVNEFSTNVRLKQHFVSVPVLLGYHFINKDNFKLHLTLGPRFDFKVSDNIEGSDWKANSLQWGGQVGLGVDLWRFTLDASYCVAADNFYNEVTTVTQTKMANVFLLSLGFKIKK